MRIVSSAAERFRWDCKDQLKNEGLYTLYTKIIEETVELLECQEESLSVSPLFV